MGFFEQFSLYDVFLVAIGLVTASIVRIFYDSYKEKKKLDELDELVAVYTESMNSYEEGLLIVSEDNEIVFSNKEAHRIVQSSDKNLDVQYLANNVQIRLQDSSKEERFLAAVERVPAITNAQLIIGTHTLPVSINSNKFYIKTDTLKNSFWHVIVMQDISAKIELQKKIESTGLSTDILTGLPTRRHLTGRLLSVVLQASQNEKESALGMLTVDNFHHLQAIFGVDKIDLVLKTIVKDMSHDILDIEELYRFDHDSFAIIFKEASDKNSIERRLRHFEMIIQNALHAEKVKADISKGVYYIEKPYATVEQTINGCLNSLYEKNIISKTQKSTIKETSDSISTSKKLSKKDFKNAIKGSDFFFFYQPIYELKKDKLIGVEVLTRFNYKKEGLLMPDIFLKQAIECGMMTEVTAHLLDSVLSQKHFWSSQMNVDLDTTINLGMPDIRSGVFTELLEEKILEYAINPLTITIDISEEVLEEDFEAVYEECYMLNKLGVKLAIDHFGKKSINLQNTGMLPLHAIKIDGSIIDGMTDKEEKIRLVSGIISMGRKFGVKVGATFVDSRAVKILLGRVGCSFAQGHYLGKPVPAFEITDLIQNG
ncbi:MAG: GGDEF domain-containing protein [Sulfurovum sp.]|nr:GGDEF domain-containing protein [Sulfurovum sp.]